MKLVITNWDALHGAGMLDDCHAPVHAHDETRGTRQFKFGTRSVIEGSTGRASAWARCRPNHWVRVSSAEALVK